MCRTAATAYVCVCGAAGSISHFCSTNNIVLEIKCGYKLRNFDRFKIVCSHTIKANSAVLTFTKTGLKSKRGNELS
jgi:hypothetical protein